jgi:hypothetical protein
VVIAGMFAAMVVSMRLMGRVWWCDQGDWAFWISDVWTPHCSQHWADPYTVTHMSHGLIFWTVLYFWGKWAPRWSVPIRWRMSVAVGIAAAWEVLENTPMVIERYRTVTMSLDYMGDSIANAVGDVAACMLGFVIAKWAGWKWAMAIFVATEIVLLFVMRDNLTLNVLMLFWPIEAIKQWQAGGAG